MSLAGKYQEFVNNETGIPAAVMEGAPHIPNTDKPRDSQKVMEMYYRQYVKLDSPLCTVFREVLMNGKQTTCLYL